jgi:hypothetical protein
MPCFCCSQSSALNGNIARQVQTKLKEVQSIYTGTNAFFVTNKNGQLLLSDTLTASKNFYRVQLNPNNEIFNDFTAILKLKRAATQFGMLV